MRNPDLHIANGTVYDPINGINGLVIDLWIQDGRFVEPPDDPRSYSGKTIDARGFVVMPGGVDMHCHIAGPKVNSGRLLTPESYRARRGGTGRLAAPFSTPPGRVPTTRSTGRLFAGIGYTTAMDAAIPPLHARAAHDELNATPILDNGFYVLLGNAHAVLDSVAQGDDDALDAYCAWALEAARGYAIKVVNPGDVEDYKQVSRKSFRELDDPVSGFGVSPRGLVRSLAQTSDRLRLPHPVHLHCNNLGIPGNWTTTSATMAALEGARGHFAHIQFHSYGGDPADPRSFRSAVPNLVEQVQRSEGITVDVGHISAGPAMILTGDPRAGDQLRRQLGGKFSASDLENESSCGVIPIEYWPESNLITAIQWAIALEWYLLMDDPWRIAMTSDHPNGGAFYDYPQIIHLLMDRGFRKEAFARLPAKVRSRTILGDLDREYSLYEIAVLTRAAPARILGIDKTKGQLGIGADADLAIYNPVADRTWMFERPRWVLKAGEIVVIDGSVIEEPLGSRFVTSLNYDNGRLSRIRTHFEANYSVQFDNYSIKDDELNGAVVVPMA